MRAHIDVHVNRYSEETWGEIGKRLAATTALEPVFRGMTSHVYQSPLRD